MIFTFDEEDRRGEGSESDDVWAVSKWQVFVLSEPLFGSAGPLREYFVASDGELCKNK